MPIKRTTLEEKQAAMKARQRARVGRPPRSQQEMDPHVAERVRVRTFTYLLLAKGRSAAEVAIEINRVFGKRVEPAKIDAWYNAGGRLAA